MAKFCLLLLVLLPGNIGPEYVHFPEKEWERIAPADAGMEERLLDSADQEIQRRLPMVNCLLVVREGKIVYEKYYNGEPPDARHSIYSMTKSITGALIGCLLEEKKIKSLDDQVAKYLPELFTGKNVPAAARTLTIRHLLTMRSGFCWDRRRKLHLVTERLNHPYKLTHCPSQRKPGTAFTYDEASPHLLSLIITRLTGKSAAAYANEKLFDPIGIPAQDWRADAKGRSIGGFGLNMTPRELARFGWLYLNEGNWDGKQLLPAWYAREAISRQNGGGWPGHAAYGYLWWHSVEKGVPTGYALGSGGQFLFVIPSKNMVAVITCRPSLPTSQINRPKYLLGDFILPAVRE